MTVREVIKQRCLIANLVVWIGFILFGLSIMHQKSTQSNEVPVSTYAGFALFAAGILYGCYVASRCPACRGSMPFLQMNQSAMLWPQDDVLLCPCCSLRFDEKWKGQKVSRPALVKPSSVTPSTTQTSVHNEATPSLLTGRKLIENQRRLPLCLYWLAAGVFMVGIVTCWFSIFAGGAIVVVGLPLYSYADYYFANRACHCPWCHHHLSELMVDYYSYSMPPEIKVCPYCARKFDDVVKEQVAQ